MNDSPDALAAQTLLTEIRTRVSTQRLHFSHGDEKAALQSIYELFGLSRKAIHDNPGCKEFAEQTTAFLNGPPRAFLANWHRRKLAGELDTRDGAVKFREDLRGIQKHFRSFAGVLHQMAYDGAEIEDLEEDLDMVSPPGGDLNIGIFRRDVFLDAEDDEGTHIVDRINRDEGEYIAKRRGETYHPDTPPTNGRGLALSGGGIRSASFCLGVCQVLAEKRLLGNFDYLSTVSGGGYTGGFLVRRLAEGSEDDVARPKGPDSEAIQYLRRRASYLETGSARNSLELVVNLLAGMVLNWTAPAALVTLAALLVFTVNSAQDIPLGMIQGVAVTTALLGLGAIAWHAGGNGPVARWFRPVRSLVIAGFWVVAAMAIAMIFVHGAREEFLIWDYAPHAAGITVLFGFLVYAWVPHKLLAQRKVLMQVFWYGAAAAVAVVVLEWGYERFLSLLRRDWMPLTFSVASIVAALPALSRFVPMLAKEWVRMIGNRVVLVLASIAVPVLIVLCGYGLYWMAGAEKFGVVEPIAGVPMNVGSVALIVLAVFFSVTALFTIDVNATGPHWLYRNGLATTFVWTKDDQRLHVPMADLDPDRKAPYILMNAVANFPNSERIELRERKGDFFLFSKHWCGSPISGYRPTPHWKRGEKEIDLGTAIATSGAAVAPHMALMSVSSATSLLTLLNIRLSVWLRKPPVADEPPSTGGHPGARMLLREMFNLRLDESEDWLLLSDGAHLENSAMYELLRRRCKFIVAVDASAEANGGFSTILTLVRHARIDLGIDIRPDLDLLRPDPETGLSSAHGVICDIDYKGADGQIEGKGVLLIIKLSMTGDEGELIKAYRATNPDFPNQSTIDQFFDEHQFEAYRQLGAHAAESLFKDALLPGGQPHDVAGWLNALYSSIPPDEASQRTVEAAQTTQSS